MHTRRIPVAMLALGFVTAGALSAQEPKAQGMATDAAYLATAVAGGPAAISAKAAVARIDAKGMVTTVRAGTNGFTCVVGVPGDPESPFCADKHALQWIVDATAGKPAPTNTAPGIAYMSKGGVHHETATGEIVMAPSATTKAKHEPPHWMIMWPFDAATSGLPTKENASGVYIMFAGTPYAHLMIYQDPAKMAVPAAPHAH